MNVWYLEQEQQVALTQVCHSIMGMKNGFSLDGKRENAEKCRAGKYNRGVDTTV